MTIVQVKLFADIVNYHCNIIFFWLLIFGLGRFLLLPRGVSSFKLYVYLILYLQLVFSQYFFFLYT